MTQIQWLLFLVKNYNRFYYGWDPYHYKIGSPKEFNFYGSYEECVGLYRAFGFGAVVEVANGVNKWKWQLRTHTARPFVERLIPLLLEGPPEARRKGKILESVL